MNDQSFLSGANATFINDLYKEWKENSNSVPKEWDLWFKTNADDKLLDEGPSWSKKIVRSLELLILLRV